MRNTASVVLAFATLCLAGCGGDDLEYTLWEADMSTVQWGPAGNAVVRPNNYWRVEFGPDHRYRETAVLGGQASHPEGTYEITSHEGDQYTVHVTAAVEQFDLQIRGRTLYYSRESAAGTITATMPCDPRMCID